MPGFFRPATGSAAMRPTAILVFAVSAAFVGSVTKVLPLPDAVGAPTALAAAGALPRPEATSPVYDDGGVDRAPAATAGFRSAPSDLPAKETAGPAPAPAPVPPSSARPSGVVPAGGRVAALAAPTVATVPAPIAADRAGAEGGGEPARPVAPPPRRKPVLGTAGGTPAAANPAKAPPVPASVPVPQVPAETARARATSSPIAASVPPAPRAKPAAASAANRAGNA